MHMPVVLTVFAIRDESTGRWTATSEDIPGLVAEAATFEELELSVRELTPVLFELNGEDSPHIPVTIQASSSYMMHSCQAAE